MVGEAEALLVVKATPRHGELSYGGGGELNESKVGKNSLPPRESTVRRERMILAGRGAPPCGGYRHCTRKYGCTTDSLPSIRHVYQGRHIWGEKTALCEHSLHFKYHAGDSGKHNPAFKELSICLRRQLCDPKSYGVIATQHCQYITMDDPNWLVLS